MDEQNQDNGQRPAPQKRGPFLQAGLWAILILAFLGTCWAAYSLLFPTQPEQAATNRTTTEAETSGGQHAQFEELPAHGLEQGIRTIDLTLLEAIRKSGLNATVVDIASVDRRSHGNDEYFHQVIRINAPARGREIMDMLNATLSEMAPPADVVNVEGGKWRIFLDGLETHEVLFSSPEFKLPPRPALPEGPKLALVIDDMGEDLPLAHRLASLNRPITFAIWPRASHTKATCDLATSNGVEILIHQPMEPLSYPKANPGPGAVFADTPDAQVRQMVEENIALVPGAVGMNNHMGSRFTESREKMVQVLSVLKRHGLFFLDSATTPHSAVHQATNQVGMPYLRRQVFLDNLAEVGAIRHQLEKAEKLALSNGQAIAIGHPHPETVQAIEEWLPNVNATLQLVRVSDLLPRPKQATEKLEEKNLDN